MVSSNDNQGKIYEINNEEKLKEMDRQIDQLFGKASVRDMAEFIPACFYFTGAFTYSDEFDTYKSLRDFHEQIAELTVESNNLETSFRVRLMLMYYCHVIESKALYAFIYNLVSIANGGPNQIDPFKTKPISEVEIIAKINELCSETTDKKKVEKFESLTKKLLPVSVAQKVQMISKSLNSIGLGKLGKTLETLHNKDVRNAFSHNRYNIYGETLLLFTENGLKRMPLYDFLELFVNTLNFNALLSEKANNEKKKLTDGTKYEYKGKYGVFVIQFIKEGNGEFGRFNVQSVKNSSSL